MLPQNLPKNVQQFLDYYGRSFAKYSQQQNYSSTCDSTCDFSLI